MVPIAEAEGETASKGLRADENNVIIILML